MIIRNDAKGLNNRELFKKLVLIILDLVWISNICKKYYQCKKEYFSKFRLECCQKDGNSKDKKAKKVPFSDIVTIINDNGIGKNNPMQLANSLDCYETVDIDEGGDEMKSQRFRLQNLAKKLRENFEGSELKIQTDLARKILV